MRLLVVTDCQAQVALEAVEQQEQARGSARGPQEAGLRLDSAAPRHPGPPLSLCWAAKTVMPNPTCQAARPRACAHTQPTTRGRALPLAARGVMGGLLLGQHSRRVASVWAEQSCR